MTVTFFGHRNAPSNIRPSLKTVIADLIEHHQATLFYVGNQGAFDRMVQGVLYELKTDYPQIRYYIVLAYLPNERSNGPDPALTIYPDGLETTPRKFAISKRNRWMVERADAVVTYVFRPFGGAAQFKALAEKKKKQIIELWNADQ